MKGGYYIFLLFLAPTLILGDVIPSGTLQARSDGSSVTLNWETDDETNVASFEVERRAGAYDQTPFTFIATVRVKGPSKYEFVDHSAYKVTSTLYQYRIKIVFSNNTAPMYTDPVTVSHTVSGVKRTWGSIKAMFR